MLASLFLCFYNASMNIYTDSETHIYTHKQISPLLMNTNDKIVRRSLKKSIDGIIQSIKKYIYEKLERKWKKQFLVFISS